MGSLCQNLFKLSVFNKLNHSHFQPCIGSRNLESLTEPLHRNLHTSARSRGCGGVTLFFILDWKSWYWVCGTNNAILLIAFKRVCETDQVSTCCTFILIHLKVFLIPFMSSYLIHELFRNILFNFHL